MVYTLTASRKEQKFIECKKALTCLNRKLIRQPDSAGNLFPFTENCNGCPDVDYCRQIKRAIEIKVNGG